MELEEYLEKLKNCEDEKLYEELGVYDNYPIYFRYDYDKIIYSFLEGNWRTKKNKEAFEENLREDLRRREEGILSYVVTGLYFVKSHVYCQVFDCSKPTLDVMGLNLPRDENFQKLVSEFSRNYNGHICLHPFEHEYCNLPLRKKFPQQLRDIAIAIEDISGVLMKEKIPACFLKIGTSYKNAEPDVKLSRIVYYNPE